MNAGSCKKRWLSLLLCLTLLATCLPVSGWAAAVSLPAESSQVTAEDALTNDALSAEPIESISDAIPEFHSIITQAEALDNGYVARLNNEEPNLNTLIFARSDGSKVMRVFEYPVKYVDSSGVVRDKSLALSHKAEIGYFTADTDVVSLFPKNLSDGIRLTYENSEIELRLVPEFSETVLSAQPTVPQQAVNALTDTELAQISATASTTNEGKSVAYVYDASTILEYTPTYNGFKEDIVVSEYTGQTEYTFRLYTGGLKLVGQGEGFRLVGADGETRAYLGDIIIFTADERNNTFGSMTAETIRENEEYKLTIHVDADYLRDERTVYPIRIDPTISVNYDANGAGAIEDVTLNSLSGSDGDSWSLTVGKRATYGISRILMRFPALSLSAIDSASQITSATVELRDLMCEDDALTVYAHTYTGNVWSESTANWSNTGSTNYASASLSSRTISYANGTSASARGTSQPHRYAFDITSAVKGWKNGTYSATRGIVFKASSSIENGSTNISKTICSYNRSSEYRPSLTVTYNNPTPMPDIQLQQETVALSVGSTTQLTSNMSTTGYTVTWSSNNTYIATVSGGKVTGVNPGTAIITVTYKNSSGVTKTDTCTVYVKLADGVYYIKNSYSNKYVNVENGNIKSQTNVYQYTKYTSDPSRLRQLWKIKYLGNGYYSIRPMHKLNMGLDVTGSNVDIYSIGTTDTTSGVASYAKWTINGVSGGRFALYNNGSASKALALASQSTSNSTNICVQSFSSALTQLWTFEKISNPPSGILLYDSSTGSRISSVSQWIAPEQRMGLTMMGIIPAYYSGSSIKQNYSLALGSASEKSVTIDGGNTVVGVSANENGATVNIVMQNQTYSMIFKVTAIPEGTYFLKNKETEAYVDIENQTMANGTKIHQWEFHSGHTQRWIFTHLGDGKYSIKSANSSTPYYLGVINDSSGLDVDIVLRSGSVTNGMKWKVETTPSGAYKLTSQTGSGYVLATDSSSSSNGVKLVQGDYIQNNSYRDEWYILITTEKFTQITLDNNSDISTSTLHKNIVEYYQSNAHIQGNALSEVSKATFIDQLTNSNYFCIIAHGGEREDKLLLSSSEVLYLSELQALDNSVFQNLKLVLLPCCYSGREGGFVDFFISKGVDVVIGFADTVEQNTIVFWTQEFIKYITMGYTVRESLSLADKSTEDKYDGTRYFSQISFIKKRNTYGSDLDTRFFD